MEEKDILKYAIFCIVLIMPTMACFWYRASDITEDTEPNCDIDYIDRDNNKVLFVCKDKTIWLYSKKTLTLRRLENVR